MKGITIPIDIPSDILIALNESEEELKVHLQLAVALMLFQEKKLTLGKSIQLSGLSRFEFEKALAMRNIPVAEIDLEQIQADLAKLHNL